MTECGWIFMDKEELFGIDDDEIDVEESMKKIRENLRRKKKKTFESPHPEFQGGIPPPPGPSPSPI